jgi:phage/plasmid-like protein (TIGR03299 family)
MSTVLAVGRSLYGSDGTQLPEGTSLDDGLKLAGLDWQVHQMPLAYSPDLDLVCDGCEHDGTLWRVNGWTANVRSDNGGVLSVTRSTYEPVQNAAALSLADDLVHGGAILDAIGSSPSGRKTFAALKLPTHITVAGEDLSPMLYVVNSHDGSTGLRLCLASVRFFCTNQLPAVWRNRGSRGVSFRHTKQVRQLEPIRKLLGLALESVHEDGDLAQMMAAAPITENVFHRYLTEVRFPKPEATPPNVVSRRTLDARQKRIDWHLDAWRAPHNDNITGTVWGAYNVAVEYIDWGMRGSSFMRSGIDSQTRKRTIRAEVIRELVAR